MADDDSREGPDWSPEESGIAFTRAYLEALGKPIFERFAERLDAKERPVILDAVMNRVRSDHAHQDAEEMIRSELFERMLPHLARQVQVSLDELRREIAGLGERLDALPCRARRVYVAVSVLQRCAARAQERSIIECACMALALPRNTVDVYKSRALHELREHTRLSWFERERFGELHLFFLAPARPLRDAAGALLDAYAAGEAGRRAMVAHEERNRLRKTYEEKCRRAKDLWTNDLPAAFDAASTRPIDVQADFAAGLHAQRVPPDQIASRTFQTWHALWISDTVPQRCLPTTSWTSILGKTDRPQTSVLEAEWTSLVRGRGDALGAALQRLVEAAKEADAARDAWKRATTVALLATVNEPEPLKAAIAHFNRSLDEALARTAKDMTQ